MTSVKLFLVGLKPCNPMLTLTSSRAWRGIPYIAEILVHDGQNVNMTALIPHSLITNE